MLSIIRHRKMKVWDEIEVSAMKASTRQRCVCLRQLDWKNRTLQTATAKTMIQRF